MRGTILVLAILLAAPMLPVTGASTCVVPAGDFQFAGITWKVDVGAREPGPNAFAREGVCLDDAGALHLKLAQRDGVWTAAEIESATPHGFGAYQFQVDGPITALDKNVVLGLFVYDAESRRDYREIDIEFSRWNDTEVQPGTFTVWPSIQDAPPDPGCPRGDMRPTVNASDLGPWTVTDARDDIKDGTRCTHAFAPRYAGLDTTQRFDWEADHVAFESLDGLRAPGDHTGSLATWSFTPAIPSVAIPQKPAPIHLNLYLADGTALPDQREAEIVIRDLQAPP